MQTAALIFHWEELRLISKPLLMPALMWWFWQNTATLSPALRRGWMAGLALSTVGDILLMGKGSNFFIGGLAAFLCAHLIYIFAIRRNVPQKRGLLRRQPGWALPFGLFLASFLYILWPGLQEGLRFPVALYATVITAMTLNMVHLHGGISVHVFRLLFIGALLFMLSDSMIAWNMFVHPFPLAPLSIMGSYLAGQALMARGVSLLKNRS